MSHNADPDAVCVMDGGRVVDSFRLGKLLLFAGRAAARTRQTFYVYFRRGTAAGKVAEPGVQQYAANPALPGEAVREPAQGVSRTDYQRLLRHPSNLVKNADFAAGERVPAQWSGASEGLRIPGVQMGFDEPGLFGRRCVRVSFPAGRQTQWVGWRQEVPVGPGKCYLVAVWLKCRDLAGGLQLHLHYHNAQGQLCRDPQMGGAGPAISGNTDWTLLDGLFSMPDDAAKLELHLTMSAHGTAWHDGVVLAEVLPGRLGHMETRAAATLAGPTAWPVNAIVKVFQDDQPPAAPAAAALTAARNEYEPLQLALCSPRALRQVRAVVVPPLDSHVHRLEVSVGVVGYVPVDHPTNYYNTTGPAWQRKVPTTPGRSDGWPGWWPDPLLPHDTFDLAAHVTQPVWVTVYVPADAAPGDYVGRVRFEADHVVVAEVPFRVHVWNFAIPDQRHIKAIFDCHQSGPLWAVPGKTFEQVRRDFWQFMAQRRVCPDRIQPDPQLRYEKGRVAADFTAFDEAADYYFNTLKLPHSYTPSQFYAFGWGFPPQPAFDQQPYEGTPPFADVDRSHLRPEYKRAYQACLKAFWEHVKAKGWEKKFTLYISDEPFDAQPPIRQQMQALCAMIHEVDPTIPIYSSTWHHQPEWDGSITVWGFGHFGIVSAEKLAQIKQAGATLWWTTDGQMCIDTPYCASERLLPHFCFKYGAEAYEFWGIDWLTYDPYAYGWHSYIQQSDQPGKSYYVRYPNGDGFLAYPGKPIGHAGPVSSIRLEQAREGCEDYEYLYLLRATIATAKQAGRDVAAAEQVLQEAQQLVTIPNAGGLQSTRVLPDPDAVFRVKERMARAIKSLR